MSNPAKAKGSRAEADVVKWLKINGFPYADRRIAGAQADHRANPVDVARWQRHSGDR